MVKKTEGFVRSGKQWKLRLLNQFHSFQSETETLFKNWSQYIHFSEENWVTVMLTLFWIASLIFLDSERA
jgi:hypothetical protein